MVLINYAKLLKNISVRGIYYGAYEAKYKKDNKEYSPIWNLNDFEILQQWTNSANIFLNTGNALPLAKILTDKKYLLLKEGLEKFSKMILVNRGQDIYNGSVVLELKNEINSIIATEENKLEVLSPILNKIKNEFDLYQNDSPLNGFLAVKWTINNGLIQQSATLLEESITTFIMCDIGEMEFISNTHKRSKVSAAIAIGTTASFQYTIIPVLNENSSPLEKDSFEKSHEYLQWEERVIPIVRTLPYKKKLKSFLLKIKEMRNDINHAGFRNDPKDYDNFREKIIERYNELKVVLSNIGKMNLPDL